MLPRAFVLLATIGAAIGVAATVHSTVSNDHGCYVSDYSYAGLFSQNSFHGFSARLTVLKQSLVQDGHVAGWLGVGDPVSGPGETPEWLQVGINTAGSGQTANHLYWEYYGPHVADDYHYHQVIDNVPVGVTHKVAILEVAHQPRYWRVWVDGQPVSPPLALPGRKSWQGDFTGETWGGNGAPKCNGFAYRFDQMRGAAAAGGSWVKTGPMDPTNNDGYIEVRPASDSLITELRPALWVQAQPQPAVTTPATSTTTTSPEPTGTAVPAAATQAATASAAPVIVPPKLPSHSRP